MKIKQTAKKILPKSEYARDSIISVAGVGFAAVIPILIYPFLGRIFTPEDFNLMGLFVSISSVLGVAVNLRYGNAVAITNNDNDAKNTLALSVIFSLILSTFFLLVFIFFGESIIHYFELDAQLIPWLFWIPLSTFFISVSIGLNGWLTRKKRFTAMAINKSVRRGGEGAVQLMLGKFKFSSGLLVGTLIGDAINFLVHFFQFKRADGNFSGISLQSLRYNFKRYIDFPKYNLIPSLLDTLSLYLPFLIINGLYNESISGQFSQSRNVLAIPLVLVSMAISQVLLQKLTEKRLQNQTIFPILRRHFIILGVLGLIGVIILYPFGEIVFQLFLGDQWEQAGEMASIMVFAYALKFVITPLSVVFFAFEKIKISGIWQIGYFVAMCLLFVLPSMPVNDFIFYYVVIEIVSYIIYFFLIFRTANKFDLKLKV